MNLWPFLLLPLFSHSVEVVFEPDDLGEFRVENQRNITVYFSFSENEISPDGNFTPSISCADEEVCRILEIREIFEFNGTYSAAFNVTIEALFLGITHLDVKINNRSVGAPHTIRVMRAEFYVTLANLFAFTAGSFVVAVTFLMGTQLEWRKIKSVMRKPVGPLIGFFCQFVLMPLTGYTLAKYGLSDDQMVLRLALFAASTCPGGGKSSFWTIIYGGNLDLSVAMTFTQTIAALVMMPLWLSTLGKEFTTERVDVPFMAISEGLVALLVPSSMGMYFIHTRPHLIKRMERYIKVASWAATLFFTLFMIYANWYLLLLLSWRIFFLGCLLPWSGYIIAFLTASIFRQEMKDRITIAIETGIQNMGIAIIIMMWSLPEPEVDISLTILLAGMLSTDKPLVLIWLFMKAWKKWRNEEGTPEEKYKEITITKTDRMDVIAPVEEDFQKIT